MTTHPRPSITSTQKLSTKKHQSRHWPWLLLLLILPVLLVVLILWHQYSERQKLNSITEQMATPTVLVTHPEMGDPHIQVTFPGTVDPQMESSVYAQVSGYVKRWLVDIGGKVKAGDLLADIDTPVTDQQLKQAQESVKQAQANLDLAKVTANRYNSLFSTHAVSQQDVDNQNSNVRVQEANLSAAKAFEGGIEKTESFKQVRAPYDGIITARRIDVGDYVSATGQSATSASSGSGPTQAGAPNQELFRVAQTNSLRVYVNVPEQYTDEMHPGITAQLQFTSAPNRTVKGKLVRTADAIDPTSLTLLSEVDVDNSDQSLVPGGYAQVQFNFAATQPPLIIPGNCLIFRQQGPQVGLVDGSNIVHLQKIKILQDLGTKLQIMDGLKRDDTIIVNPSDSLTDGQKVNVKQENQPAKQ